MRTRRLRWGVLISLLCEVLPTALANTPYNLPAQLIGVSRTCSAGLWLLCTLLSRASLALLTAPRACMPMEL